MAGAALSYCGALVQAHDPDRFLLSMFAPARVREDLWALFAFNHEITKTREVVSETQLGLIRLQWWREALAGIYEGGETPGHEVLQALARAAAAHDLPRADFDRLVHAREFDLEDVPPGTLEGLVNYADFTTTPLMRLALRITGGGGGEPVRPVAVNYALAGILRAAPSHARQRRCYLPADLLQVHGQRLDDFYAGKIAATLPAIVKIVAGQGVAGVVCENRLLKAANRLAGIYLRQLAGCGYDVFHPKMALAPAFKTLRLFF